MLFQVWLPLDCVLYCPWSPLSAHKLFSLVVMFTVAAVTVMSPGVISYASSFADYIRGVDVIAETHFVLTKGAQSFEWEDYGFRLHAPKGSLPEGLDQCEVKVKVSLSGHFDLPESSELVSAVYWVYSPHLFLEPLTVEIQHCAAITTPTQCAQLTFIRTKCTQKELPYRVNDWRLHFVVTKDLQVCLKVHYILQHSFVLTYVYGIWIFQIYAEI